MPESAAAVGAWFEGLGAADVAVGAGAAAEAGAGEAAIGGGLAAGAGAGAGEAGFGAGLAGFGADAELGAAGASFGATGAGVGGLGGTTLAEGAGAAGLAGGIGAGVAPAYGGPGTAGAGAGTDAITTAGGESFFDYLQSAFGKGSPVNAMFSKGGVGMGLMQVMSSMYGLEQSRKLQSMAKGPGTGATDAGMQAVQRSMAAQGYQGSGNMAAALQKYGTDAYNQNWQTAMAGATAQQAGVTGTMSSLGLLTAGLPNLFGWGGSSGSQTTPGTGGNP